MKLTIHSKKTIQSTNLHHSFFKNEVKQYGNKKQIITPLEKARSIAGSNDFILECDGVVLYNSFKEENRGSNHPNHGWVKRNSSQRAHGHQRMVHMPLGQQSNIDHPKPKKKISFR